MTALDLHTTNTILSDLLSLPAFDAQSVQQDADMIKSIQPLLDESLRHQKADWAAHMSPSLAPYSTLGLQMAALHGGNLLSPELYPLLKQAETETLSWLCHLFHQQHAHFTHGSSYGNLEALWKAREFCKNRNKVYGSIATHYSIIKACQILGLEFIALTVDEKEKLDINALELQCQQEAPLAIVLNMGTTASGTIDPLNEAISIGRQYDTWLHIDAAWGGALVLLPEYVAQFDELRQTHSICFDPHKALYQPKPCSVILYHQQSDEINTPTSYLTSPPKKVLPGSYGGELFLPLWLNFRLLGLDWFSKHIRTRLEKAQHFADQLKTISDWRVLDSETGIVCFQPKDYPALAPLQQGLFSTVELNHKPYYRAVFAGLETQTDALLKALQPFL